ACGSACRSADRGIRKRKAGETSRGPAASAATDAPLCSIARSSRSVVCRDRGVDGYLNQYCQSTLAPGTESAAHAVERLLRGDHSLKLGRSMSHGIDSKYESHWTGSVQGAVATWSNYGIQQSLGNMAC